DNDNRAGREKMLEAQKVASHRHHVVMRRIDTIDRTLDVKLIWTIEINEIRTDQRQLGKLSCDPPVKGRHLHRTAVKVNTSQARGRDARLGHLEIVPLVIDGVNLKWIVAAKISDRSVILAAIDR